MTTPTILQHPAATERGTAPHPMARRWRGVEHLRPAIGWMRTWPLRRWLIGIVAFVVVAAVYAGTLLASESPSWWRWVVAVLGGLSIGLGTAGLGGAPSGRPATLCDARPILFGATALYFSIVPPETNTAAGQFLAGYGTGVVTVLQPLLAIAGILASLWAVRERFAAEAAPAAEGEVCVTCRPLPTVRRSSDVLGVAPGRVTNDKADSR